MKKVVLLAGAMLALTSSLALATDINIAWNDCVFPYGIGVSDNPASCTSNSGANILVASFEPPYPGMPHFNGSAGVVDIQVAAAALSPWWRMDPAGPCRAGKLTGSFDFTAGPFSCTDIWAGLAAGGIDVSVLAVDRLRVRTVCAVAVPVAITDGLEYYAFKLTISNSATVDPTCAGCTDPACFVFQSLLITQPAGEGDYSITTGPYQYATWRGGAVAGGCPAATPTQKSTWGSVKALYR